MNKIYLCFLLLLQLACLSVSSQTGNSSAVADPINAQFFLQRYIANPAYAGLDTGLQVGLSYRKQWADMPGAPETKMLTAGYYIGNRIGAGLQVYNDKAGLLSNTRIALTYAYHVPLNEQRMQRLSFGLSGIFYNKQLDKKGITGDPNDPATAAYNRRDNYFESDFGVVYSSQHLRLQASVPNIVSGFSGREKTAGTPLLYTAASYVFELNSDIPAIEPLIAYRNIYGSKDILDMGMNVNLLRNWLSVTGLYHTSGSFSAGAAFSYASLFTVQFMYSAQTNGVQRYTGNGLELNLLVKAFKPPFISGLQTIYYNEKM